MPASFVRQIAQYDPAPSNIGPVSAHSFACFNQATLPGSLIIGFGTISFFVGTVGNGMTDYNGPTSNPVNGAYALKRVMQTSGNVDLRAYKVANALSLPAGSTGLATSTTTTSLSDTSKNWTTNQWAGYTVTDAIDRTNVVASNTATTLTYTAAGTDYGTGAMYAVGGNIIASNTGGGGEDYPGTVIIEIANALDYVGDSYAAVIAASGTDNINPGNTPTLPAGSYGVLGFALNDNTGTGAQVNAPSAGTGNVSNGTFWTWDIAQNNVRVQFKNQVLGSPGTLTSLFSSNFSAEYMTIAIAISEPYIPPSYRVSGGDLYM